jgi:hypothetical protein
MRFFKIVLVLAVFVDSPVFACEPKSANAMTMKFSRKSRTGIFTTITADRPVAVLINWCVFSAELGATFTSQSTQQQVPLDSCESMVFSLEKGARLQPSVNYIHTEYSDGQSSSGTLKYCVAITPASAPN